MTGTRTVEKQLACIEDLLLGKGVTKQVRNGVEYDVTKITLLAFITTIDLLATLDVAKYSYVAYFNLTDKQIKFYFYNTDTAQWELFDSVADQAAITSILASIALLQAEDVTLHGEIDALADAITATSVVAQQAALDITAIVAANILRDAAIVALQVSVAALGAPIECLVRKTGTQAISNPGALVNWDSAAFQRNGTFWAVGSPTKLTVPAGVTKIQVAVCLAFTVASPVYSTTSIYLRKNGAGTFYVGKLAKATARSYDVGARTEVEYAASAWLDVTAGDYFELYFSRISTGGAITVLADNGEVGSWINVLAK